MSGLAYWALILLVSILTSCSPHSNPLSPTTPLFSQEGEVGVVSVQSMSEPGCNGLTATLLTGDTYVPSDGVLRVQFNTTLANGGGLAHLAVFNAHQPTGSQDLIASSAPRGYVVEDKSFTISLQVPAGKCGIQYQVDAGCGPTPPEGASYTSETFVMSWQVGTPNCGLPTPTPTVTPTPTPQVEVTPTPSPTPTLTPTGTPQPTPTPTPSPTPRPTVTPTPTMTPRPTPTPTCGDINPPTFTINTPIPGNPNLTAAANVANLGSWQLKLFAASSLAEYNANNPDFTKDVDTKHLECGGTFILNLSYGWAGHDSEYWWTELRVNGTFMGKSTYVLNPYN